MFGNVRPTGAPQLRLFGIPIRIEPVFLLIIVILGIGPGADATLLVGWVVIVFVSILGHELGHAVAFLAFGSKPSIVLYGLGGVTTARTPPRRWQSVVVSLAGPVPPLVLLGLPALILSGSDWAQASDHREVLLRMVVWVNVWWGLVNLLPLLPLDGGHVAEEFVGPRVARILTIVVAVPVAVYAFQQDLIFAAGLALLLGYQAWRELRPAEQRRAEAAAADGAWVAGLRLAAAGNRAEAIPVLVDAARAGPPSPAVVGALAAGALAPEVVEQLLAEPGERPPVAAAEIAGGLLAAGHRDQATRVAALLATDPRSPALQEWAAAQLGHPPA